MSAADSEAAIDRVVSTYKSHGDNGAAYLLTVLAILAGQSPEVVEFCCDRADEKAKRWAA